jgi:hemoglobin
MGRAAGRGLAWTVVLAIGLSACAERPIPLSLYSRIGGQAALVAVVDQLAANIAADRRIRGFFAATDMVAFKAGLADQLCMVTGGPCRYAGPAMRAAHVGRHIGDVDFDAFIADLVAALDHFNVPPGEKEELLGLLAPMRRDIVGA